MRLKASPSLCSKINCLSSKTLPKRGTDFCLKKREFLLLLGSRTLKETSAVGASIFDKGQRNDWKPQFLSVVPFPFDDCLWPSLLRSRYWCRHGCSLELCIPFPLLLRTNNMHVTVSSCTNHNSCYICRQRSRFSRNGSLLLIGQFKERNAERELVALSREEHCVTKETTLVTPVTCVFCYHPNLVLTVQKLESKFNSQSAK